MARRQSKDPLEKYSTPAWVVERLLERMRLPLHCTKWLDPCANDGALMNAVFRHTWANDNVKGTQWDISPASPEVHMADFLEMSPGEYWHIVIMNPPFSRTQEFVDHALKFAPHVLCLGRLGLLSSEERADWMRGRRPSVYVLPNRPSFTPDGQTDRYDYAWYHFERDPVAPTICWLGSTPKAVRKRRAA